MPGLSFGKMSKILLLVALLVAVVAAESIRETETMDPNGILDIYEGSGSLPDDEDLEAIEDDLYEDSDEYDSDFSGSGASDDLDSALETPNVSLGNKIPDEDNEFEDHSNVENTDYEVNNEIIPKKESTLQDIDVSNKISMASTTHGDFFQRTEVVVALIAGGLVGLLFAVFIIVLLYMRLKRNPDKVCDPVKKPIYKKAPTNDV